VYFMPGAMMVVRAGTSSLRRCLAASVAGRALMHRLLRRRHRPSEVRRRLLHQRLLLQLVQDGAFQPMPPRGPSSRISLAGREAGQRPRQDGGCAQLHGGSTDITGRRGEPRHQVNIDGLGAANITSPTGGTHRSLMPRPSRRHSAWAPGTTRQNAASTLGTSRYSSPPGPWFGLVCRGDGWNDRRLGDQPEDASRRHRGRLPGCDNLDHARAQAAALFAPWTQPPCSGPGARIR